MDKRRIGYTIGIIACVIVAAIAGWNIYQEIMKYKIGNDLYDEVSSSILPDFDPDDNNSLDLVNIVEETAIEDDEAKNLADDMDWDALEDMTTDQVGWIYIPNTNINYPVCYSGDNSYYLTHLVDKTYNANGCIFMEEKNHTDLSDDNTILYGHHMRSGKMFQNITKYKTDKNFYRNHPNGYYLTEDHVYRIEFFSGYETQPGSDAYMVSFGDKEDYGRWLAQIAEQSCFEPMGVGIGLNDKVMTLSTCDYDWHDARFVLHGKLVQIS